MKNNDCPSEKPPRLLSLDVLRGLDIFLLTVIGPLFRAVDKIWPQPEFLRRQFQHAWGGFTLWDFIMPLFIFICGAALPFALSRRLDADGRPTSAYWRHVIFRVALLWFCGLLVQGNLATLDLLRISPFNNTLQAIAAGYLIAALVFAIPSRAARIAAPVLLAAVYGALLHCLGDYSPTGNFAARVEARILTAILPAQGIYISHIADPELGTPYQGYTWFLTTLMFGSMTLCGVQCAELLRGAWERRKKALALGALGGGLLALGGGLVCCGVPSIKHIYTVSFTCLAMGGSVLALALLYTLIDVLRLRRGWGLFSLYGQCALTAYMASHFFRPALLSATQSVTQGIPHLAGDRFMPLATALVSAVLLTFVCWVRRRMCVSPAAVPVPKPIPPRTPKPVVAQSTSAPIALKPIQLKRPSGPAPAPTAEPERPDAVTGPNRSKKTNLKLH